MDPAAAGVDDVHMPGQDGRAGTGWVTAVAALLACVLLSAVGVAALRSDTASADTVLQRGEDVRLVLEDGTSRTASEGDRVPPGATVTAGVTGAELATRDRVVHLGGDTSVTVLDGARQVLRSGFVLVDAPGRAPGVELQTASGTVTTAQGSLVRVDGGSLVRVGVLRGDAAAVRAAGRRATSDVDAYFQVQVPQGGLPGARSPFVLTPGDAYERVLAADLVRADEDLTALASRLDADGAVGRVVMTALRADVPGDPAPAAGAPGSESALGFLIARASDDDAPVAERYRTVRGYRSEGGSWGVVAAIVDAEVDRVSAALGALLDPGTVPVLASGPLDVGTLLDPSEPQAPAGSGPSPDRPAAPADPVEEVVEEVVDTVLDMVSPSPSVPPVLSVPVQAPVLAPTPVATLDVRLPPLLR
jgi:hypothetical protein